MGWTGRGEGVWLYGVSLERDESLLWRWERGGVRLEWEKRVLVALFYDHDSPRCLVDVVTSW